MNAAPPLVLLHGWGFSSRVWKPFLSRAASQWPGQVYAIDLPGFGTAFHEPCNTVEDVLDFILEQLPARSVLCGWSLGGMLATRLAATHPQRVAGLVTLGSNLHFTRDKQWPGMLAKDYQEFCTRFADHPHKTWQHFLGLQTRGDLFSGEFAPVLKQLASFDDLQPDMAAKMLQWLGDMDNRSAFAQLRIPGLHLFGEHDAITPVTVVDALYALNPQQQCHILPATSHALCITRSPDIAAYVRDFAKRLSQPNTAQATPTVPAIDRRAIARSFSHAAQQYDGAAGLQRTVADYLLQQIAPAPTNTVLDAGCGTGYLLEPLATRGAHTIALDLAPGMLRVVQQRYPTMPCVQADMQSLPLADDSIDTVVSSLAMQWCPSPLAFFHECRRVLRAGGQLHLATFLPGTLRELQRAWQAVDDAVHVNTFTDITVLLDALAQAGFTTVEAEQQTLVRHYNDIFALARELKTIGAHNLNPGRPTGLTGKQRWQRLQQAYEPWRDDAGLPAHYEVLYVSAT